MKPVKRSYVSGCEKRKKKKEKNERLQKQKDSLLVFLRSADGQKPMDSCTSKVNVQLEPTQELDQSNLDNNSGKDILICSHLSPEEPPNLIINKHNYQSSERDKTINQEPEVTNHEPRPTCSMSADYPTDIALWPLNPTPNMIDYFIRNKPENIGEMKNLRKVFSDSSKTYFRNINENHFYRLKTNGTKEKRNWLIFSETSKSVYCYVCKLFPDPKQTHQVLVDGYSDWSRTTRVLNNHETSKSHLTAMVKMLTRSKLTSRVDVQLITQVEKEKCYWRQVLYRVVATVKLLARLGLPFRGHRESDSSVSIKNKGNFLTCMKYLAEFDDFLKEHLEKYESCGSGSTNYLSHQTYDEILTLMAKKLEKSFSDEVKNAQYFSIIVDSTPDVSHVDQLTFVLRYVKSDGQIVERFFCFLPIKSHKAEFLKDTVLKKVSDLGLDMKNCRGQCYDNASNMSGVYAGLQAKIKEISPTAFYVPCSSHSLNLVGNNAAECCSSAVSFFDFIQKVYTFFSASTHRWDVLKSNLQPKQKVVKQLSDTRWSARADAVSALRKTYSEIRQALIEISECETEKLLAKIEAKSLAKKFDTYEIAFMTVLWDRILQRMNNVSKTLQKEEGNMKMAVDLLQSLKQFISDIREDYSGIDIEAKNLSTSVENPGDDKSSKRQRKRKRFAFADESTDTEIQLQGKDKIRVEILNTICDKLVAELGKREEKLGYIFDLFKYLFTEEPDHSTRSDLDNISNVYLNDIDGTLFCDELHHFRCFVNVMNGDESKKNRPEEWYKLFMDTDGLKETFPNVETILRVFLTIPVSNATGERSFSALKRVKNYLRSGLSQEHLNSLSILYIESKALVDVNYDEVIDTFSTIKARKKFM